jgi:hypothetical protein
MFEISTEDDAIRDPVRSRCVSPERFAKAASRLQPVLGIMDPIGAARILVPTSVLRSSVRAS